MSTRVAAGRALSLTLAGLVLLGGICPAVYGSLQPHRHVFLGGPPPVGWQNHVHPNPLFSLLGPPGGATHLAPVDDDAKPGAGWGLGSGKIVSMYAGGLDVLSLFLDAVILAPTAPAIEPPRQAGQAVDVPILAVSQVGVEPPVPPPRSR